MQKKHVLQDMLEPVISGLGYETVRILTIGQVNPTLQIMIDKLDGSDIVVEDCATVSRKISEVLDANDPIKDKYNLEVSSPGLDRPLTKPAHFARLPVMKPRLRRMKPLKTARGLKAKLPVWTRKTKFIWKWTAGNMLFPLMRSAKPKS